jgi:hypothetical protein
MLYLSRRETHQASTKAGQMVLQNHESGMADREMEIERLREREKFLEGQPSLGGRRHQRSRPVPTTPKMGFSALFPVAKQWESGFFSS